MCHLQQHKLLLSPIRSQVQITRGIFGCTNCNEPFDIVRDLTQHLKTHKKNNTPSPRTPKTPKCLTLEQNPSFENVQNHQLKMFKIQLLISNFFILPPAINRSFTEELSKKPGSINLTECVTHNVCKSIYQNVSKVRLHQAMDHPHLSVYCDYGGCPFIFKTKCGMTKQFEKKHLKILKPTPNVDNVNSNPTSVYVSRDSDNNSSEVLNLSCD